LHVVNEIGDVGRVEYDRVSGKGLVQTGLEGQCKCATSVATASSVKRVHGSKAELLHLVFSGDQQVIADVQDVGTVGAHALGAIDITPGGIAHTGALLVGVPAGVREGRGVLVEVFVGVVIPGRGEIKILNVLACAVARAVIGAGAASASLAFVAIEAVAFAAVAVANAPSGALCVLVELSLPVGGVHPSDVERANALRAIAGIVRQADAVVVVAVAHVVGQARAVAAALVVARRASSGRKECEERNES